MKTMHSHRPAPSRQQGVILLIALIALVAMTLAAIGLVRSIDTSTLVAGNIGFRQSAVATADSGIETARAWILANTSSGLLLTDQPAQGYYSTRQDSLDITGNRTAGGTDGVDWAGSDPTQPVKAFSAGVVDSTGAKVSYLIHRLCSVPGDTNSANQSCATASLTSVGSTQSVVDSSKYGFQNTPAYFYRITVRVDGAKNTVSYVQALVEQ